MGMGGNIAVEHSQAHIDAMDEAERQVFEEEQEAQIYHDAWQEEAERDFIDEIICENY